MAFNTVSYPSYNPYRPAYNSTNYSVAPPAFGHMMSNGSTFQASPPQNYPPALSQTTPSSALNFSPGGMNAYSQFPSQSLSPGMNAYKMPYKAATPIAGIAATSSGAPAGPMGYMPPPIIIYANSMPASPAEQRKKFWSKFMMNTGSTVAGLALAAYFGKKLLPQAIAQELGSQFRMAILPQSRKDAIAQQAEKAVKGSFLSGYKKSKKIQEEINKITLHDALSDCTTEVMDKVSKSTYMKNLKPEVYAKDMFGKVMSDNDVRTYMGDSFKAVLSEKMLDDPKFKAEIIEKVKSEIEQTAQSTNGVTGWLLRKVSGDLAEKNKTKIV